MPTEQVDGNIFKNCSHGLGADYIQLFDWIYPNITLNLGQDKKGRKIPNVKIPLADGNIFMISYDTGKPVVEIKKK